MKEQERRKGNVGIDDDEEEEITPVDIIDPSAALARARKAVKEAENAELKRKTTEERLAREAKRKHEREQSSRCGCW